MEDYTWNSILVSMEKEKIMLQARTNVNKEVLFDLFKKNNIQYVVATFDGCGDNGSIEKIEITPEEKQPLLEEPALGFSWPEVYVPTVYQSINVKDAIETICYDILRITNRGWETDAGSYGTFEFRVKDNKVKLDFYERSVANYEYDF